jgi:Lon protease (S16) C-terminal proteolytic domain
VLGHLASLHHKLAHHEEAARYEERFVALFRYRMHRPSREQAARAAARFYIPLDKLVPATLHSLPASRPLRSRREQAVDLALRGDLAGARANFAAGGELLDLKYLADLTAMSGSRDEAIRDYIACLRQDPGDFRVVGWLLDEYRRAQPDAVASYFRQNDVSKAIEARLTTAIRDAPVRASLWRHREALHRIAGREDEAARCALRAGALEQQAERRRAPVGRVLAAAVYHFVGKARGLVHEVWATRRHAEPGRGGFLEEILGNLTPELIQAVRNAFLSVREYARARWPLATRDILDYSYSYKVTKDDEPSGGTSAGLPTALAFLSVFLDRPVPQDIASTGVLVADSHDVLVIKPVGEPEYKVRGACNRNLRLMLPEGNRRELADSPLVPAAIRDEVVSFVSDLDQAVVLTWGGDVFVE